MAKLPKGVNEAVAEITAAKKKLADACRTLARLTKPGHPTHLIDPDWEWAQELMDARRAKLLAIPGVVGIGLGFRLRGGMPTGEPCLTVYVRRKISLEELKLSKAPRIPKTIRSGKRRLPIDVIAFGKIRRQVSAGDSLGPLDIGERGTLGVLAKDLDVGDTVALTAMHVSPLQQFPAGSTPAPRFITPVPGGGQFATLRQGTMSGTDAAKLALDVQQAPVSVFPTIGQVKGWRPITYPGDQGTTVKMFGAVSGFQSGYIVNPIASIPSESLDAAILVNISTQGGDSGAALVDHEGLLLGFLVGECGEALNNLRVFTPASLVFATLRCDIPTT